MGFSNVGDERQLSQARQTVAFASPTANRWQLAWEDICGGLKLWPLWFALGWSDILQRYRRSVIGPFWLTVSMAIMVVSLGLLYGEIFHVEIREFIPFLCAGLLIWGLISSLLNESGVVFTSYELFIKQIKLPYTIYVWRFVWAKVIIFAHSFVIYFAVLAYFQFWPGAVIALALPGFLLLLLNGFFVSLYLGMISARFRDVPQIIASATQVIFFLTPVLWNPNFLGPHQYIANWNPFYHLIELVRSPLLGQWPSSLNLEVTVAITAANLFIAMAVFPRFRARIAYWV